MTRTASARILFISIKDLRLYRPYACSLASLVQLASVIGQFGLLYAGIRRESVLFLSAWTTGGDDELVYQLCRTPYHASHVCVYTASYRPIIVFLSHVLRTHEAEVDATGRALTIYGRYIHHLG